ncbi:ATP synthase mitochondrial F1 complex assembly factor 1-like [Xenia sp. Carnegie-2017]|uniref:ATP synthase mitochondrial F1 complex assembly factor 1-like n=1 Tax=Xenia sp. Carnegie-2017 TaxID=2897299 RepID=UPI001F042C85|nr:ATP synthase mitochondrial F1 complex assembly factor 1-like [Xenia sp. Carnegie-2017]
MAANRGVRMFFKHFVHRTTRNQPVNLPSKCTSHFCTDKREITSNPFFEKYAEKIQRMQESTSILQSSKSSSFLYQKVLEDEIAEFKKKSKNVKKHTIYQNAKSRRHSNFCKEGLDAIMHLDKVKENTAAIIEELWKEYHRNKDSVSAVIPSTMYDKMMENAKQCPIFIYPIPRNEGFELMVGEFSEHEFYLTSVINYQTLGENAPWIIALKHFTELKESKGIVLMTGEVDTNHLAIHEAMFVANLIQLYYGTDDDNKLSLLKTFNHNPDQFNHMSVIEEMQRSTVQY